MKAQQLLLPNLRKSGVWICMNCNRTHADEKAAEACCRCRYCSRPVERSHIGRGDFSDCHGACAHKHHEDARIKALAAATVVADDGGPVFADGFGHQDGFFADMDSLLDHLACNDTPKGNWPERVHPCKVQPFGGINIDSVIENVTEDLYDGAYDDLDGVKELDAAIDAFNKTNADIKTWDPIYDRAVLVPKEA